MYSVTWILGSGISKTCLVVILTGNISWRLEEQQGQISSLISTVKSGVSTFSKVCPLWLSWPPEFLSVFSLRELFFGFFLKPSVDGGLLLLELFKPSWDLSFWFSS